MSRPCLFCGTAPKCEEEAMPASPFCNSCGKKHSLGDSFTFCEEHEIVHLSHFRCPACVLADLGFRMDVLLDKYPMGSSGKYVKGKIEL